MSSIAQLISTSSIDRLAKVLTLSVLLLDVHLAAAQTVSLTAPLSNSTVVEGDDFATRELGNPWDMNQSNDMGWEEGFNGSSVGTTNGVWQGTNSITGAYVLPLFPDFKGALPTEPIPGDKNLPGLGILHKIKASKYNYLCYRLYNSARSSYAIYWSNNPNAETYWPDGTNKAAKIDGFYIPTTHVLRSGWEIYCHDMLNMNAEFDVKGGSWSGDIIGFRIDPSINAPAGATSAVDWVRIVDRNSSPTVRISWSTSGINYFDAVTLFLDTDGSGYDGTPMMHWARGEAPSYIDFPTAALPPGNYRFYVGIQRYNTSGVPTGSPIYSGYSAQTTVTNAPQGYFSSPSMTSGDEYFGRETGNPVDMNGSQDVLNLASSWHQNNRQFVNPAFISHAQAEDSGLFTAIAEPPLAGNTESDVQMWMPVSQSKKIDPGYYRYFVYRMFVDPAAYSDLSDRVQRGWVTRPIWANGNNIVDNANSGDPGAAVTRTGWQNYAVDLTAIPSIWRGRRWESFSTIEHLRFDPLETPVYTQFWVDWVRLYSENHTSDNQFTISFNLADADSSSFNVSLYYDSDKSGFDGGYIGSMNGLVAGNHSYVWNTTGLPQGNSYYVYMVVSDGSNTAKFYSPVHVKIGNYSGGGGAPVGQNGGSVSDVDGDGTSDVCVLKKFIEKRKASATKSQIVCKSKAGATFTSPALTLPQANSTPIAIDVDGDNKADWAAVTQLQASAKVKKAAKKNKVPVPPQPLVWNITSSSGTKYQITFGQTGDHLVHADYEGSGKDNIAVFRAGFWYIRQGDGSIDSSIFGQAGDLPAPADYDGDGKADKGIFRPSTGEFWYQRSTDNQYVSAAFGGSSDVPVPSDIDGDGKADLVLHRISESRFYVKESSSGSVYGVPVGGNKPMKGYDLDGDGKGDLVASVNGSYYAQTGLGEAVTINVGGSSDKVPGPY